MFELILFLMGANILKRHGHQIGEVLGTGLVLGGVASLGPQALGTVALARMMEDRPDLQRWVTAATAAEAVNQRFQQRRQDQQLQRHDRRLQALADKLEELGVVIDDDGNLYY